MSATIPRPDFDLARVDTEPSAPAVAAATRTGLAVLLPAAVILLWPAMLNGYPLVFADSGTYLSQAIQHYLGWDRPAFYSLFLFLLHWQISTWPIIVVQSLLTLYVLDAAMRAFAPRLARRMLLPLCAVLAILTPLPWFVDQIMPDLFTTLMTILLAILVLAPASLAALELLAIAALCAAMIAFHLSHLWIGLGLLMILLPTRQLLGATRPLGLRGLALAASPLLAAVIMLCSVNCAAFGRLSVSPFGNVFLLARLLYDGPAAAVLERDCATEHWQLCRFVDVLPPHQTLYPSSDNFLWEPKGPLSSLGGAKLFSLEAGLIISRALHEQPLQVLHASLSNFGHQLLRFGSGDGLHAWPDQVGPVIARHFPAAEGRAFLAARQSRGLLGVPPWMRLLHGVGYLLGVAGTLACLVVAARRRSPMALLCAAVLLCLLGNAAVTGILSGPHDRYQNRVIWLALLAPLLVGAQRLQDAARPALARPGPQV
ncbi:hypothetical protein [Lichenicoccus sp.]|uniref:hypothetical protein n=1 Tax=Lichenicoccus sp. TaxID=2781899 RepID=UPI003D0D958A